MLGGLITYGAKRFFADSWNIMDTVVVGSGWLDLAGLKTGVGMLRMVRVFRPLRTLTKVESMRLVVQALVSSIPGLANVLLLAAFMIFIFALFGLKLWIGVLSGRCFSPSVAVTAALLAGETAPDTALLSGQAARAAQAAADLANLGSSDPVAWPGSHHYCCADVARCGNETCSVAGEQCVEFGNPENGNQSFDNIGTALLVVFQAMTAEGWSEIMDHLMDSQDGVITGVYFTCLMILGGLFVTNYLLAECCVVFGQHMDNLKLANADEEAMEEKRKEQAERDAARAISFMSPAMAASLAANQSLAPGASSDVSAAAGDADEQEEELLIPAAAAGPGATRGRSESVKAQMNGTGADMQKPDPAAPDSVAKRKEQGGEGEEDDQYDDSNSPASTRHCGKISWLIWCLLPGPGWCVCFCPVDRHAIEEGDNGSVEGRQLWWFKRAQLRVARFVESARVDSFLTTCISVNFVLLALDHHGQPEWWTSTLEWCNYALTGIFSVELVIKVFGFGPLGYFGDPMNWLDAVCVVTSLMEVLFQSGGGVSALRVLRLMRILRSMKMIKDGSALKQMIETAIASMKAVVNFGVLLLLLIYIFTLLGMNLFGGELFEDDGITVPRANFDTFIAAFLAVFQVSTRENWHKLLYSAMSGSSSGAAIAYFVTLLVMTNYILLALFMGTLLQNFQKHFSDVKGAKVGLPSILPLVNVARQKFLALRASEKRSTADIMAMMAAEAEQRRQREVDTHSLWLFSRSGKVRRFAIATMASPWFERSVLFAIGVSSTLLAVEHPNDLPGTTKATILKVLDVVFTAFFVGEMSIKIIALGFVDGEEAYTKSTWNLLDGTVVIISILTLLPGDGGSIKFLRVLRTVRALRPLQAVNKWPGLRTVVQSLANSVPSIMIVNTLAFFFVTVFGILFVQLFGGALYYCTDETVHPMLACTGTYVTDDGSIGKRLWLNQRRNFDNIIEALLVMFELLTLEEWDGVMHSVVDATDKFHGPLRDNSLGFGFAFIFYIIAGSFFILNLFVGVIVSAYNEAKAEAEHGTGMSATQEKRRTDGIKGTHAAALDKYLKLSSETVSKWQLPFLKIIMHPKFEWVVLIAILSNVGFMCLEHVGQSAQMQSVSETANEAFAWLFLGEMIFKVLALGPIKYWRPNWNKFDGFIVTISMVELAWKKVAGGELPLDPTVIRLFRIFRVARFVRMAEKAKGIKNLIQTFLETLPYLVNVAALLSIFLFIYAVVGVALFTNVKHQSTITEYMNFGDFASAITLLVRISTGEGWAGAMRDCQVTPPFCGFDEDTGYDNCGDVLLAPLYFVTYMLVCCYVSLNVIVAVILFTFFDLEGNPNDKSLGDSDVAVFLSSMAAMRRETTRADLNTFASSDSAAGDENGPEPAKPTIPTAEAFAGDEMNGLAIEGKDGLPVLHASKVPELLLRIKDPLGCPTDFHLTELRPKLDRWMRKELPKGDWDPSNVERWKTVEIGAAELLRFLVVYNFDVDVAPKAQQKKNLWNNVGKVSVLQDQPDQEQGQNGLGGSDGAPPVSAASAWTTSDSATGSGIVPLMDAGEDIIKENEKAEAKLQRQHEEEALDSAAAGLPGLASPTGSPAASDPDREKSIGPEDSLTWMEDAVEPSPTANTSTNEGTELDSLSELEREVEDEQP
eukprot:COSAG02_NODE_650_length_18912_cov_23.728698_4_plen_1651_part_00